MSPFLLWERCLGRLKVSEARISFNSLWLLRPKQANFLTRLGGSRCTHALPAPGNHALDFPMNAEYHIGLTSSLTGRGAARLARLLWEQEVGGSNPLAPTRARL